MTDPAPPTSTTTPAEMPDLLTISEVAQQLRVDNSTVYRLLTGKTIPYLRYTDGGKMLVRRSDLDAWIASRVVPAV